MTEAGKNLATRSECAGVPAINRREDRQITWGYHQQRVLNLLSDGIPRSVADISDRNSDFEEKINISDYLPDGLKLTSDSSEDVFVRVNILPEGSNVCEVPTKNIIVNDSPEGMQVSFDTAKIEIRVKKTSDDLADLTEGDIKASIDLKGMSEGSYEVPVSIEIPKGYELVDEVTTGVEISKISTADESN